MELIRQTVHIIRQRDDPFTKLSKPRNRGGPGPGEIAFECFDLEGEQGETLVDVVVQLARDTPAFVFLHRQQPCCERL